VKQFIPFEDDWDALARFRPEDLVPYRVGMVRGAQCDAPAVPPASSPSPSRDPVSLESPVI
jgi:hypothetical protein